MEHPEHRFFLYRRKTGIFHSISWLMMLYRRIERCSPFSFHLNFVKINGLRHFQKQMHTEFVKIEKDIEISETQELLIKTSIRCSQFQHNL